MLSNRNKNINDFEITTFIQAQVTKTTVEGQERKRIMNANKVTKALYTLQKHKIIDNGDRNLTRA